MPVTIAGVEPGSIAERSGIRAGQRLVSIGGAPIRDVLDYRFYLTDPVLELVLEEDGAQPWSQTIRKEEYEDIGLLFDTYLMDRQRPCQNKCVFCFIDQLPPGMRESLYFKDDDSRLSFLFGNYITLTNLEEEDVDRIIRMRISPVNVSVHTTDPDLRVRMMANPKAGTSLAYLERLAGAGIRINAQLVLCPGINDGPALEKSLEDLGRLLPALQSVAVVPVGLTQYRRGLPELRPFTAESAARVIDRVEAFSEKLLQSAGERIALPADEFFLLAGRPLPDAAYYGDFNQLENGVGLVSLLRREVDEALEEAWEPVKGRRVTVATGTAAAPLLEELARRVVRRYPRASVRVLAVENRCFGSGVTVAGLVTGADLIRRLEGEDLGDALLIPSVMLRRERDLFLDDLTVEDVEKAAGCPVRLVDNDGYQLVERILLADGPPETGKPPGNRRRYGV